MACFNFKKSSTIFWNSEKETWLSTINFEYFYKKKFATLIVD